MKRHLCLVLDIDDTLYLERDYVQSGFRAVGDWSEARLEISGFAERACELFQLGHRGDIFNRTLAKHGYEADQSVIAEMVSVYRNHTPRISLLPDAVEFLNHFRGKAALGVISDGALASQQRKVQALGLDRMVDVITLTGEWGARFAKPHQRAFEYVQSRLGGEGAFVYIADNPAKDFIAPRRMGWSTARVRRAGGLHFLSQADRDAEADIQVDDLRSLIDRFECGFLTRGVPEH